MSFTQANRINILSKKNQNTNAQPQVDSICCGCEEQCKIGYKVYGSAQKFFYPTIGECCIQSYISEKGLETGVQSKMQYQSTHDDGVREALRIGNEIVRLCDHYKVR